MSSTSSSEPTNLKDLTQNSECPNIKDLLTKYPEASLDTKFQVGWSYQGKNTKFPRKRFKTEFVDVPHKSRIPTIMTREEVLSCIQKFHSQEHSQDVKSVTSEECYEDSDDDDIRAPYEEYEYDLSEFYVCQREWKDRCQFIGTKDVAHLNMYVTFSSFYRSYGTINKVKTEERWDVYRVQPVFMKPTKEDWFQTIV